MKTPQRKIRDIQRLLSAFPPQGGDPEQTLRNYVFAVDEWAADLVEAAVDLYLCGKVTGFDGRFAPTPPMLATGCRIAADAQARARYLENFSTPRLPSPQIVHTAEERQRVRRLVEGFVAAGEAEKATLQATREHIERWNRVHARFDPPQDDQSLMQRLLGYSVGSPESEENAA